MNEIENERFKVEQNETGFRIIQKTRNPYKVLDLTFNEAAELFGLVAVLADKILAREARTGKFIKLKN